MQTQHLAVSLMEGRRFIASPYRTGVHIREDVFARQFSVRCTGTFEDSDESGAFERGAFVTIGHCGLIEEAIAMAQDYVARGCFLFSARAYRDEQTFETVTFQPLQIEIIHAGGERVLTTAEMNSEAEPDGKYALRVSWRNPLHGHEEDWIFPDDKDWALHAHQALTAALAQEASPAVTGIASTLPVAQSALREQATIPAL